MIKFPEDLDLDNNLGKPKIRIRKIKIWRSEVWKAPYRRGWKITLKSFTA